MLFAKKFLNKMSPALYGRLAKIKRAMIMRKFGRTYPDTKLFYPTQRKLYSQDDQDYIIYNGLFQGKDDGVFCDVGGNHPLNLNNTRYFEELGWSGYVFEPLPYMRHLWRKHRKATFFPFAASDSEGEVIFSIVKDATGWEDMLSYVKETKDIEYRHETEDITVRTRALKDVFKEEDVTHIDYMSIDVEGHEMNVLQGIDFDAVDIRVLSIENNPSCCYTYGDDKIRALMFENGYHLWGRIAGLDDIYVKKGFQE